jgi:hypothetical protein
LHGYKLEFNKKWQYIGGVSEFWILEYVHKTIDVLHVDQFHVARNHSLGEHDLEQAYEHTQRWYLVGDNVTIAQHYEQMIEKPRLVTHDFVGNIGHRCHIRY